MTINGRDYTVLKLLGKGKGGYSYLVTDGDREYVIKQIHHEPCDYYTFGDKLESELRDYARLCDVGIPVSRLLAVDREQERILKEYIPGKTVLDCVLEDAMEDGYIRQMESICAKLRAAGLNIDYFPTNFIVNDGQLVYIDYECNDFDPRWSFENWGVTYWQKSPQLMSYAKDNGLT